MKETPILLLELSAQFAELRVQFELAASVAERIEITKQILTVLDNINSALKRKINQDLSLSGASRDQEQRTDAKGPLDLGHGGKGNLKKKAASE